jgi:hypothetical protein
MDIEGRVIENCATNLNTRVERSECARGEAASAAPQQRKTNP